MDKADDPESEESDEAYLLGLRIRESQGLLEQEVSLLNHESDLHKHAIHCRKNPGHQQFIHIKDFSKNHLPAEYQDDEDLVQLVKAQADLTCCIKVKHVSNDRPDTYESGDPYPFSAYRGRSNICRTGSGWANRVFIFKDGACPDHEYSLCPCEGCVQSGERRSDWAKVEIWTVAHLVFDDKEARHTQCYFFYDDPDTTVVNCPSFSSGFEVGSQDVRDVSWVRCVTHDIPRAKQMQEMCQRYHDLCQKLCRKYRPDSQPAEGLIDGDDDDEDDDDSDIANNSDDNDEGDVEYDEDIQDDEQDTAGDVSDPSAGDEGESNGDDPEEDKEEVKKWERHIFDPTHSLVIITSHPHGSSKMVSIGHATERVQQKLYVEMGFYIYTTPTCTGSSGAPVYVLGRGWKRTYHAHSGELKAGLGSAPGQLNRSAHEWY